MSAGRKNTLNKTDWNTPKKYIDAIIKFFGEIDLDPSTNCNSLVPAKTKFILPTDGLQEDWSIYKRIYINPPFGRDSIRKTTIKNWVEKAFNTNFEYGNEILILIPSATNTSHFQKIIFKIKNGGIVFLNDTRLRFLDSNNSNNEDKKGSPIGMTIIYFGKLYKNFENVFKQYGKCFEIIN